MRPNMLAVIIIHISIIIEVNANSAVVAATISLILKSIAE